MVKHQPINSYICRECGASTHRWEGRCAHCRAWNSIEEMVIHNQPAHKFGTLNKPLELADIGISEEPRVVLSSKEFNRVLGGGLVPGSLILVGGEPGIGKSTLLLQTAAQLTLSGAKVLYISGEESAQQIKLRSTRLGIGGKRLYVQGTNNLDIAIQLMGNISPHLVIVDSIQTVYSADSSSSPGSPGQIRDATWHLLEWSKDTNIPVIITGHVTKEGSIAGPRMLEHMVDVVIYLEGDPYSTYRMLRCVKNRFGSTNEVGLFEMGDNGLADVLNPSKALLSGRSNKALGSVILPVIEGTRPILVEIQALTSLTTFNLPRRTANGFDLNRLILVTAILSKYTGVRLSNQDIVVNIVGGIRVREPAADLAMGLAILSSLKEQPVEAGLIAIGELGLSGEVRPVSQTDRRLKEAAQMGVFKGIIPTNTPDNISAPTNMHLIKVASISEAARIALTDRDSIK